MKKSNLYLLRIIAMLMILVLHYNMERGGGLFNNPQASDKNISIMIIAESICIVAVNTFIITSGYFMVDKKPNKLKVRKIVNIVSIIIFYGVIIAMITLATKIQKFNSNFIKMFINSIIDRWFLTNYIILLFISPFINKMLENLEKSQYGLLILIMLFFFSIWPSFFSNTTVKDGRYGIINFVILYLIGGYIRRYHNIQINKNIAFSLIIFVVSTIMISFIYKAGVTKVWDYNFILVMIASVALFYMFNNIKMKSNKIINYLASFTLDIYIIHGNPLLLTYLFRNIFKTGNYWTSDLLPLHCIACSFTIYFICVIIGTVRKFIYKYSFDKINDKIKIFNKEVEF